MSAKDRVYSNIDSEYASPVVQRFSSMVDDSLQLQTKSQKETSIGPVDDAREIQRQRLNRSCDAHGPSSAPSLPVAYDVKVLDQSQSVPVPVSRFPVSCGEMPLLL